MPRDLTLTLHSLLSSREDGHILCKWPGNNRDVHTLPEDKTVTSGHEQEKQHKTYYYFQPIHANMRLMNTYKKIMTHV